jgi:hypothetical protein
MKERFTISFDPVWAQQLRQMAGDSAGGVSGYLERLVRQQALREAVRALGDRYDEHPEERRARIEEIEADEAERAALGVL